MSFTSHENGPKNVYIPCEKKDACTDAKHKINLTESK